MNLIEKAKGLFRKKPKGSVFLRVQLDGLILGVSLDQPEKPWIEVQGVGLEEAAKAIPRIDWHTLPMSIRAELELGNRCLTVTREDAAYFLKTQREIA